LVQTPKLTVSKTTNQAISDAANLCKQGKASIKDLQPFLHTDLETYLAKRQKTSTCISCLNCMKRDNTIISYKYKPNLETAYTATFTDAAPYPNTPFVMEVERKKVKTANHQK